MSDEPQRSRAAFWILAILVLATLANLVVGQMVPLSVRPVTTSPGGSLSELVATGPRAVSLRYGFYFALRDLEAESLFAFPESGISDEFLGAFAGAPLEVVEYDPTGHVLPELDEPEGTLRLTTGGDISYWIVPGEPGDAYWLAQYMEGYVAVADSVVPFPGGQG